MIPRLSSFVLTLQILGLGVAQGVTPSPLTVPDFLVPLHTAPVGGDPAEYGVWAMGRTWKASFHDGFVFYPRPAVEHGDRLLPLRYRLHGVTVGDAPVAGVLAAPERAWTASRYELRWPGVTEVYDIRPDGVEQSFVLAAPPATAGDLRIVGEFETDLRAAPVHDAHTALVFADPAGQPLVRYGEATAIDAIGRRLEVTTSLVGNRVTLRVDGAWLAQAHYPVVVDPLTTRVLLNRSMTFFDRYFEARVVRNTSTGQLMLMYGQAFGTSDVDVLAYVTTASFGSPVLVFSHVGVGKTASPGNVTYVGGSARYALAFLRTASTAPTNSVRVYLHASGNTTLNSGTNVTLTPAAGQFLGLPDIGGSGGTTALMVHEQRTGTTTQEVVGRLVNATALTVGSPFVLSTTSAGTSLRREGPTVSALANGAGGSWVTAWHEQDKTVMNDDFDLKGSRITGAGAVAGIASFGPDAVGPSHKLRPKVDGAGGRYVIAWQQQNDASIGSGLEIGAQRFDWSEAAATPTLQAPRVVDSNAAGVLALGDVAADSLTTSHWALIYRRQSSTMLLKRLGSSGATVETQSFAAVPTTGGIAASFNGPGICFDAANRRFPFAHTHEETFLTNLAATIYAQHFTYPADAQNVAYGTGCGGSIVTPQPPYAGHEFHSIDLTGAVPNTPAVLEIALTPSAIPLDFFGMPGCFQNVDPATLLVVFGGTTNGAGTMRVTIPVRDDPPFLGDLYFMYAYFAPGANARGLLSTQGMRVQYR